MKQLHILTVLICISLASACSVAPITPQQVSQVQAANALLDLQPIYTQTREALLSEVDRLPTDTGLAILDLDEMVTDYVTDIERSWKIEPGQPSPDIERTYVRGKYLYERAVKTLTPHLELFRAQTRMELKLFADALQRIDAAYQDYMANPQAQQQMDMAKAQIQFATLAVKLGMLLL